MLGTFVLKVVNKAVLMKFRLKFVFSTGNLSPQLSCLFLLSVV